MARAAVACAAVACAPWPVLQWPMPQWPVPLRPRPCPRRSRPPERTCQALRWCWMSRQQPRLPCHLRRYRRCTPPGWRAPPQSCFCGGFGDHAARPHGEVAALATSRSAARPAAQVHHAASRQHAWRDELHRSRQRWQSNARPRAGCTQLQQYLLPSARVRPSRRPLSASSAERIAPVFGDILPVV